VIAYKKCLGEFAHWIFNINQPYQRIAQAG
jgi:hypothetical protein